MESLRTRPRMGVLELARAARESDLEELRTALGAPAAVLVGPGGEGAHEGPHTGQEPDQRIRLVSPADFDRHDAFLVPEKAEIILGRGPGVDVEVPDQSVSKRHASLRREGSELFVRDLGSRNGTFVRNALVPSWTAVPIHMGDALQLGARPLKLYELGTLYRTLRRLILTR